MTKLKEYAEQNWIAIIGFLVQAAITVGTVAWFAATQSARLEMLEVRVTAEQVQREQADGRTRDQIDDLRIRTAVLEAMRGSGKATTTQVP